MIIKKNTVTAERAEREGFGITDTLRLSDAGALSQYGANVQIMHPGARSSNNHWHENEDEFLYVLSGEVTVTEGEEAQVLHAGDVACWPAGAACSPRVQSVEWAVFLLDRRYTREPRRLSLSRYWAHAAN